MALNKITVDSLAANAVTNVAVANGTIVSVDLADGSVTGPKIGLTAINANNIVDGSVTVAKGGTGLSTLTANSVVLGNGTDPVQLIAPGTSGNVLTSNGTNWTSQAAAAGGGDYVMQVFTTPGTWTKPAGLKAVKVTVIGGGGGSGGAGGTTSFGSPAFLSATGGAAGSTGNPHAGGSGSGGTINANGGRGSALSGCATYPISIGGGSAFGFGASTTASSPTPAAGIAYGGGGAFTSAGSGGGGGAIEYIDAPALPGPQPYTIGSGGPSSPAPSNTGGAAGVIIVEEFY